MEVEPSSALDRTKSTAVLQVRHSNDRHGSESLIAVNPQGHAQQPPEPVSQPSNSPTPGEGSVFLARGNVADVWLMTLANPQYVSKVLRFGLDFPLGLRGYHSEKAITELDQAVQQFVKDLKDKAERWKTLNHKNIVAVYGVNEALNLRVEFCSNGNAWQFLKKHDYDPGRQRIVILDLLAGIIYMHAQDPPVIHGSLCAAKIFVNANGTAKIGEFGLFALTTSFSLAVPSIADSQSSRWMSPELVQFDYRTGNPDPSTASDIWALGCTLLELISHRLPYSQYKHEIRVRRAIIQGEKPTQPSILEEASEFSYFGPFILQCWEKDPSRRPELQNAVQRSESVTGDTIKASAPPGGYRAASHIGLTWCPHGKVDINPQQCGCRKGINAFCTRCKIFTYKHC